MYYLIRIISILYFIGYSTIIDQIFNQWYYTILNIYIFITEKNNMFEF